MPTHRICLYNSNENACKMVHKNRIASTKWWYVRTHVAPYALRLTQTSVLRETIFDLNPHFSIHKEQFFQENLIDTEHKSLPLIMFCYDTHTHALAHNHRRALTFCLFCCKKTNVKLFQYGTGALTQFSKCWHLFFFCEFNTHTFFSIFVTGGTPSEMDFWI